MDFSKLVSTITSAVGCITFISGIIYILIKSKLQDDIMKNYVTKEKLTDVLKPVMDKLDELSYRIESLKDKLE